MLQPLKKLIEGQTWVDGVADPLQKTIGSLFAGAGEEGKNLKDFLNGVWLGHPLHPMITDVPVGAWVCTALFDTISTMSGDEALEKAADITLATGLSAAVGAALSGFTDWSDTYGEERTVGLLHGLTMVAATATYSLSLAARMAGARRAGVTLGHTGFAIMSLGAYLGGDEVYDIGYPVNHTAFSHGSDTFVDTIAVDDLTDGKPAKADAGGTPVVLVKDGPDVYALHDTCVHAGCSLAGGAVDGRSIICPCHGSTYDLLDGSVIHGPATMPEPSFEVRVRNGRVEVRQAES